MVLTNAWAGCNEGYLCFGSFPAGLFKFKYWQEKNKAEHISIFGLYTGVNIGDHVDGKVQKSCNGALTVQLL